MRQKVRPNRSLNRTLHSVPAFVPAKTLAQIPRIAIHSRPIAPRTRFLASKDTTTRIARHKMYLLVALSIGENFERIGGTGEVVAIEGEAKRFGATVFSHAQAAPNWASAR